MTIDDIDFLYDNSEIENFILYCDSSIRDRNLFPYPNRYTVHFQQPFRNVVGIEVLDASIPSTMYNIESDANSIAGFTYVLNRTITTQTADYSTTLQYYMDELDNFTEFDDMFNSKTAIGAYSNSVSGSENLNRTTGQMVLSTFELIHQQYPSGLTLQSAVDYLNDIIPTSTTAPYFLFRRGIIQDATIFKYIDDISIANGEYPVYKFTSNDITYAIINDPDNLIYQ
jgi:hypothetical protein